MATASIKQKEQINESKTPLMVEKRLTYRNVSDIDLRVKFNELKENGVIINDSFSDDEWIIIDRFKENTAHLRIKKEMFKLKSFVLVYANDVQANTLGHAIAFVLRILTVTDNLKMQNVDMLEIGQSSAYLTYVFELYLDFAEENVNENRVLLEKLIEREIDHTKSRVLPNYQSVLIFEYLIDRFIENDLKNNFIYYPIVLWWKFTLLIPTRPIEFFTLKKSDFKKDETGCYVRIHRSMKSDPENKYQHQVDLVEWFKIDEALYALFEDYINRIDYFEDGEGYIFNAINVHTAHNREYMGTGVLRNLKQNFYDKIIRKKYGYEVIGKGKTQFLQKNEIERIDFGDTRHLAFLNLIVSGYNPYTIAQLGGHRNISTQFSYYSGLTTYCTSKAFSLANGITTLNSGNALAMHDFHKKMIINEEYDLSTARRVDGGYCVCTNYPYDCMSLDCGNGNCEYFFADDINDIMDSVDDIQADIGDRVELLKAIMYSEPNDSVVRSEAIGALQEDIAKLSRVYKNKIDMEKNRWQEDQKH